eukprot:CAMPEP_0170896750 /NCGR_PEP_ID=MMETSP0734-20130129/44998_1 /TAXON_ID=186038 /ORGANISM="Fragilariopsis kerguelensis, Strain L26-C5" /LENGTH=363 /DNA_ID=CAMNT_0011289087 /DNA_START=108 /DNA_END=1197 /DNA_ORIENTATION=+
MKFTSLAILSVVVASSTAFGLNGGAKNVLARSSTRSVGAFQKVNPAMVQPVDTRGVSLNDVSDAIAVRGGAADVAPAEKKGFDIGLTAYFFLWYLGNYLYNITNKLALNAAGGKVGFPMTLSSLQLGVGALSFCFMGAHSASVFAMGMGAVSFAQIVKASEPAFSAVLSQFVYGKPVSKAKWLCLPIVIGGVILASVKELDFAFSALISACIANMFAAVKGNENKKLMDTEGLKDRLGSVGNQFAITSILAFLFSIPLVAITEGSRLPEFIEAAKTTPAIMKNLVASGLWFYGYNECATLTLKKTSAVTQSVANTAKRVIVIVGVAVVMGESLNPMKLLGCSIGIGGVLLYSIIDGLVAKKKY